MCALNLYFSLDARGRGQHLLHDGGAMSPRKFISNFEGPYLHSPMRLAKNCVVKIIRHGLGRACLEHAVRYVRFTPKADIFN
jgi:hypothetical protein